MLPARTYRNHLCTISVPINPNKMLPKRLQGILAMLLVVSCACATKDFDRPVPPDDNEKDPPKEYKVADIDLSHWKVTLPIGRPTEVYPPEILDYATNETLKPFMYNDSTDASIVFYTYPGATTANTSYSRTELRELMDPSDLSVNWTFPQGGRMVGEMAMEDISTDDDGKKHRSIIMQIHGRLSNQQRDLIGAKDNNAPPILKIYWAHGKIRVKTKVLKDLNYSYEETLHTDAWGDDEGKYFEEEVGYNKFKLEVVVSSGRMEVTLNDKETFVYDDMHMQRWNIFDNYFKAGNYLATKDKGSYAKVKLYSLEVQH